MCSAPQHHRQLQTPMFAERVDRVCRASSRQSSTTARPSKSARLFAQRRPQRPPHQILSVAALALQIQIATLGAVSGAHATDAMIISVRPPHLHQHPWHRRLHHYLPAWDALRAENAFKSAGTFQALPSSISAKKIATTASPCPSLLCPKGVVLPPHQDAALLNPALYCLA